MPPTRSAPVCVVSADASTRRRAAEVLRGQGHATVEAGSLAELTALAGTGIAAAVVDPRLAELGATPLSRLRALPSLHRTPVLVLSESELGALASPSPAAALIGLALRVSSQVAGGAMLGLLADVGGELTAGADVEATTRAVLDTVVARVACDTATLFVLEGDDRLIARASWGYELDIAALRTVAVGDGVVGWVAENRVPTIVGDSALDSRFQSLDGRSSRSMLAVPLLLGGRVVGAISLVRRTPAEQFTDTDLILVGAIGNSAGAALENARLAETERVLTRRLAEVDRLVGQERAILAKLETYDRMYTQVVATVSHELKTPLMGIRGFAALLREGGLRDEEIADFAREIHDNAVRLSSYVESILSEDAVHSGRIAVDTRSVRLRPLVEGVLRSLAPTAAPSHSLLNAISEVASPVEADPDKLLQVVTNLVSNAIKYSPDGGRIRILTEEHERMVELIVEDEGLGIPEEARERIFDRFYRVPQANGRTIGGTGLGLSIVRGLVELHGGSIWVDSGPEEQGSRFHVLLPRALDERVQPGPGRHRARRPMRTEAAQTATMERRPRTRTGLARLAASEAQTQLVIQQPNPVAEVS